jgi:hypothetical protein
VVSVVSEVVMIANIKVNRNAGCRACHTVRGRESPAKTMVEHGVEDKKIMVSVRAWICS